MRFSEIVLVAKGKGKTFLIDNSKIDLKKLKKKIIENNAIDWKKCV